MRLAPIFFACISGGPAFAQNAIADWLPMHAGDKRTYQHETRDTGGGRRHLEIHLWQTEEIITGSWIVPEGTLVGRRVRVVDGSPQMGRRVDPNPAFLVRGDCLYRLGWRDWEPSAHHLTPDFLKWLNAGEISADFCFPLAVHKTWGAQATDWEVVPGKQNAVHITSASSYLGSGMTADIWFEKGVGVVREEEIHHGTIGEARTRLLRFQPASEH
jgi:hypothetical protein